MVCDKKQVIICDIEGTTTSISFVKDKLFPHAEEHVEAYLSSHWEEAELQAVVQALRDQYAVDKEAQLEGCIEIVDGAADKDKQIASIVANVKWQMANDRKTGALKQLQGMIWTGGYKAGHFKGHVYDDVKPAFEAWTKSDRKLYIYSSGSAAIQRVHFAHSDAGDLAQHLSDYFDTKVGAKQEKGSYEAIAKAIDKPIDTMLFLTDVPGEARAAKAAGMEVILLKRPGNVELTEADCEEFQTVSTFADIHFSSDASDVGKRKCDDDAQGEEVTPPAKVAKIDSTSDSNADGSVKAPPSVPATELMDTCEAEPVVTEQEEASKVSEGTTKDHSEPAVMVEKQKAEQMDLTMEKTEEKQKTTVDKVDGDGATTTATTTTDDHGDSKEVVKTDEAAEVKVAAVETADVIESKTDADAGDKVIEIESVTKIEEDEEIAEPKISDPNDEHRDKECVKGKATTTTTTTTTDEADDGLKGEAEKKGEDEEVAAAATKVDKDTADVAVKEQNGVETTTNGTTAEAEKKEKAVEKEEVHANGQDSEAVAKTTAADHSEAAVENGTAEGKKEKQVVGEEKEEEKEKTNGHDDSDKENGKDTVVVMEGSDTATAEIIAKKCSVEAAVDLASTTPTSTTTTAVEAES